MNGLDISVALKRIKPQCGGGRDDFFKLYRY